MDAEVIHGGRPGFAVAVNAWMDRQRARQAPRQLASMDYSPLLRRTGPDSTANQRGIERSNGANAKHKCSQHSLGDHGRVTIRNES